MQQYLAVFFLIVCMIFVNLVLSLFDIFSYIYFLSCTVNRLTFAYRLLLYPKWESKLLIFEKSKHTLASVVGHQPTLKKGRA